MVIEAIPSPGAEAVGQPADELSRLSDILLARGALDNRTLDRARRVAADTGGRLDRVLTQLGMVSERDLAEALAELVGSVLISPADYPEAPLFVDRLKPKFLHKARALPIADTPDNVILAMADPLDGFVSGSIAAALGRPVAIAVAVPIEFEAAFNRLYPESESGQGGAHSGDIVSDAEPSEEDTERLKDLASEAPVIRLVNQLIARAVETGASDVHIEPFEDRLRIRYRYDGALHEAEPPPARLRAAVVSRVKIMSRLDIAERRLPQDGRIRLSVRGQEVDFRVSTIPSLNGESVVLRVLDRTAVEFDFVKLGLPDDVRQALERVFDLPNGMVLVTGPTGSGKTTTLYTGLLKLNSTVRNIITVEDPVEYQLAGINQIQVKPQIGLNFATLLRSILRHDPDVIMIGEIRDLETAQIAVQAALTGHLVLSTVHTNSAAATVTRLRDMGVEDYLLSATLKGVLAQRLVRRLCPKCKIPEPAAPIMIERFGLDRLVPPGQEISLYRSAGCPECRDTGYRGRRAIAELLVPTQEIDRLIFQRADQGAIERAAVADGMRPIFDAGLLAVIEGDTTIEEVVRCIRSEA
ncbi:MAG: type II secretion system protein GspE [Alphaproteobacteria bacterium]|jgi:general secretion pathway protein E|nr:MAG: type II secretion system protein GspE [Alphaproteobacteria bacterium]TMK32487.1 MAG: type II secretion system protein GspE [Alphaproteobacteria bacterium]